MIAKLPKKPIYSTGDIFLPQDKPEVYLTAIKGGWMLYSKEGKLVGQVFIDKTGATVAIGDSRAYRVTYDVVGVKISPLIPDDKAIKYEIFGDVETYRYEVYEYKNKSVTPILSARVIPVDYKEYYAKMEESSNVYRNLLLIVAITSLVERN